MIQGGTEQPTGEPRRTVSGYIKICGAPSGGNHGESVWVITTKCVLNQWKIPEDRVWPEVREMGDCISAVI